MSITWRIGDKIQNRWEIHRIIQGGMGIVYLIYDHEYRKALAAKTFRDKFLSTELARAGFIQEAQTWINLGVHPNVTAALFVEIIQGKPLLFLEYVSGGDLSHWIGTSRLIKDLPQVLLFAIQFCDGMSYALANGIKAHRDIKPQNCLVTEDLTLKITDFGLAKVIDSTERKGGIGGTPPYMSPEQWGHFGEATIQADIYSFGIMLFEMIVGHPPFQGPDYAYQHEMQLPPHIKLLNPDLQYLAADLESVIHTCIAKDPAKRFSDFSVIREYLADIYRTLTGKQAPHLRVMAIDEAVQFSNQGMSLSYLGGTMRDSPIASMPSLSIRAWI